MGLKKLDVVSNLLPLLLSPSLRWNVTFFTRIDRGAGAGETLRRVIVRSEMKSWWSSIEDLQGKVLYFTPLARVALRGGNPSKLTLRRETERCLMIAYNIQLESRGEGKRGVTKKEHHLVELIQAVHFHHCLSSFL